MTFRRSGRVVGVLINFLLTDTPQRPAPKPGLGGGVGIDMMALSLQEAADQAGISRVDVWRAIQSGSLPALKTRDNGYIIDPNELFRVFERPGPSLSPEPPGVQDPSAAEKQAAETDAAMAAIAAELKFLLGARGR